MALKLNTGKFKLVGGHPSVDFVNTVGGRIGNPARRKARDYQDLALAEKLKDYADLVAWSWRAKLLDEKQAERLLQLARERPREAARVLKRAVALRESLYRLFKSVAEGWKPEASDLETMNKALAIANRYEKLAHGRDGFVWEWDDRAEALDSMLWQIVSAGAELLAAGDLSRLRQCGGEKCGWMFLDTSRNRSRHWCDMKDCGNLAKVRRFRQKNAA